MPDGTVTHCPDCTTDEDGLIETDSGVEQGTVRLECLRCGRVHTVEVSPLEGENAS